MIHEWWEAVGEVPRALLKKKKRKVTSTPSSQIISHFKNLRELNNLKFDQTYVIR
jgi:hypothetical protein